MLFFFVFYKGSFNFSIGFCKVIGYIDFLYRNFEILKNSFFFFFVTFVLLNEAVYFTKCGIWCSP